MPDNSKREFETPKVLHDAPLRDDDTAYFHFDDFARTLARLIATQETRTPLTIGVSGPWGSGKTTLLQRTRKMLDATRDLDASAQPALLDFANDDDEPQSNSVPAAPSGSTHGSMPAKIKCWPHCCA